MSGTRIRLASALAVLVAVAAFVVPAASARTRSNDGPRPVGYHFITDTLGGNGKPKSVHHLKTTASARISTGSLGGGGATVTNKAQ